MLKERCCLAEALLKAPSDHKRVNAAGAVKEARMHDSYCVVT